MSEGDLFDARQGFTVRNTADNDAGTVHYALSLKAPALPVSGSGTLWTIPFRAIGCGTTPLNVARATLVSGYIQGIPVAVTDSWVSVLPDRTLYLPITVKTSGNP